MSYVERYTWVSGLVSLATAGVYVVVVLGRLRLSSAAEVAYELPLLVAAGATIVLTILATILASIGTAISSAISGSGLPGDFDRSDERDAHIDRRGELVGYYVSSAGILGALALAMLRQDHFWIANAIYLSFVAGSVASTVAKLLAYRRGF